MSNVTALARRPQVVPSSDEIIQGATETGLVLPDGISEREWANVGESLGRAHRASGWWIGDWINYAESKWGEKYDEAQEITGLSYDHLRHCATVAKKFQIGDRSPNLTWSHYNRAKALPNADEVLALAEAENWSVRDLQEHARPSGTPLRKISPKNRHGAFVTAAGDVSRIGERWSSEMVEALSPPEARKQLTILNKAAERLAEVIAAVEYRAATPHRFMGR